MDWGAGSTEKVWKLAKTEHTPRITLTRNPSNWEPLLTHPTGNSNINFVVLIIHLAFLLLSLGLPFIAAVIGPDSFESLRFHFQEVLLPVPAVGLNHRDKVIETLAPFVVPAAKLLDRTLVMDRLIRVIHISSRGIYGEKSYIITNDAKFDLIRVLWRALE